MKFKVTVLALLIIAVISIFAVKSIKNDNEDYSANNSTAKSSAQLIDNAKNNKQPAWLLFHSTT